MFRRRPRRPREIAFSLDSFLDLVANVVGIIIRLILVAWIGARSYKAVVAIPLPEKAPPVVASELTPPADDPKRIVIDRSRKELQDMQDRLLAQVRRLQELQGGSADAAKQLALLTAKHDALEKERGALDRALSEQTQTTVAVAASMDDLRKRRERLDAEIRALEQQPSAKKVLRYRTPVSRPVRSDELHFECRDGRVTFIDIATFLTDIKDWFQEKAQERSPRWTSEAVTQPAGAFRLRFYLEFERDSLGRVAGEGGRVRLDGWTVEPLALVRGEPADAALSPTSAFRQIVDALDPNTSVVTFWVYADSFPLYRRLRDYLYERGIEVAGRPLPIGMPIESSRHGTVSRGQ